MNVEFKNKLIRYEDKFDEMEPKWERFRQIEGEYDVMKRKNANLNRLNERFEARMEEMKKFALRL